MHKNIYAQTLAHKHLHAHRQVSASTADETDYRVVPFLQSDADISPRGVRNIQGNTHAEMYPDGALRWGWKKGCDFVTGSAKDWPKEYVCEDDKQYGCTADHLMSARFDT